MKKMMFLMPLAALAMASCSSDIAEQSYNKPAADGGDLIIRPSVQGATRGESFTSSSLDAFKVKIYGAFNNASADGTAYSLPMTETLTKDADDGSWKFDGETQYWWADNTTLGEFKAWAPSTLSESNNKITVEIADEIASQQDVIVAYNSGTRDNFKAGVPLNFQHVLSQVVIKALNQDLSAVRVEVAGVKVVNVANKNTLTLPDASTANGTFSWSSYTPWTDPATYVTPNTPMSYNSGANATNATGAALTDQGASIMAAADGVMLLMPQDLADVTDLSASYLAVLVRITDLGDDVPLKNYEGKLLKAEDGSAIPFDAKSNADGDADTYYTGKLNTTDWTYTYTPEEASEETTVAIKHGKKVIYPREGRGNNSQLYAYVAVPITTDWQAGYRYTYTLNFAKDAYGIASKAQNDDLAYEGGETENNTDGVVDFPYGVKDLGTVESDGGDQDKPGDDPVEEDKPVVDSPVQLLFTTVTVDTWQDAAENVDMK